MSNENNFSDLDFQVDKYENIFKDMCFFASSLQKRHNFFLKTYKKAQKILSITFNTVPLSDSMKSLNSYDSHVAPGIVGDQINTFKEIFKLTDKLVNSSRAFSSGIQSGIIDTLSNLSNVESELIEAEKTKVNISKSLRNDSFHAFKNAKKQTDELFEQIVKEQKKSPNSPKIPLLMKKYFQSLSETKLANKAFNMSQANCIKVIQNSIIQIKVLMVQRITQIRSIFFVGYPLILSLAELQESFANKYENRQSIWESEFMEYVTTNKITRTPKNLVEFECFNFSFDDIMLPSPFVTIPFQHSKLPLYLAIVLEDFEGQNKNELSVKKDEKLFVYENPHYEWTLVSNSKNQFGFIPTKFLDILKERTVLTKGSRLKTNDDILSFSPSELLIVKSENEDDKDSYFCENMQGSTGVVHKEEII